MRDITVTAVHPLKSFTVAAKKVYFSDFEILRIEAGERCQVKVSQTFIKSVIN
jgi:hypothetical protein